MPWSTFKSSMASVMSNWTYGQSMPGWAAKLATEYDKAVKSGKTNGTSIPLQVGQTAAMQGLLIKTGASNYNGIGIAIDSTYGNTIETAKKNGEDLKGTQVLEIPASLKKILMKWIASNAVLNQAIVAIDKHIRVQNHHAASN